MDRVFRDAFRVDIPYCACLAFGRISFSNQFSQVLHGVLFFQQEGKDRRRAGEFNEAVKELLAMMDVVKLRCGFRRESEHPSLAQDKSRLFHQGDDVPHMPVGKSVGFDNQQGLADHLAL